MKRRRFLHLLTLVSASGTLAGVLRKGLSLTRRRVLRQPPVIPLTRKAIYSEHDLAG